MIIDRETKHSYYISENNYYSNEPHMRFNTVTEFLDAFDDTDVDLNLVFRFDVFRDEEDGHFSLFIAIMHQRKGIYRPIECTLYDPVSEGERLTAYLRKHFEMNLRNWAPLSLANQRVQPAATGPAEQAGRGPLGCDGLLDSAPIREK